MLNSRSQQRLNVPVLLIRTVGVLATVFLLLFSAAGCGGQSTQGGSRSEEASAGKPTSEKAAAEEAVRGYYQAVDAKDFEKAYSYYGPTLRKTFSEQEFIEIQSLGEDEFEGLTINYLEVGGVSGNKATASADVSYHYVAPTGRDFDRREAETQQLVKERGQWKLDETSSDEITPLALVPLAVNVSSQDAQDQPGWRNVTIPFGIRNDNLLENRLVEWPRPTGEYYPRATVSIEEGRQYDFGVDPRNLGEKFTLPPGFAVCGTLEEDPSNVGNTDPANLEALGQIPQKTTPTTLSIEGFYSADLTAEPNRANCAPAGYTANLPEDNATLVAHTSSASQSTSASQSASAGATSKATVKVLSVSTVTNVEGEAPYARTILTFDIQNKNKFGNFVLYEPTFWLLDDDGVVRSLYHEAYNAQDEALCDNTSETLDSIDLGPSEKETIGVCFPYRKGHHAVAVVFEDPDAGIYEVVKPTEVIETGPQ